MVLIVARAQWPKTLWREENRVPLGADLTSLNRRSEKLFSLRQLAHPPKSRSNGRYDNR
jgi:hypothetical protein